MVIYKHNCKLNKEEKSQILGLLSEVKDPYGDFYLTKNNLRLFIAENSDLLYNNIEEGDYIAFDENGMAIINGFCDNSNRKYLKVLCKNPENLNNYIKVISWDLNCDLFIKIKKNNPLKEVLIKNGFEFFGGRGKEILLKRKGK